MQNAPIKTCGDCGFKGIMFGNKCAECWPKFMESNPPKLNDFEQKPICAYCGEDSSQNREKHLAELATFLKDKAKQFLSMSQPLENEVLHEFNADVDKWRLQYINDCIDSEVTPSMESFLRYLIAHEVVKDLEYNVKVNGKHTLVRN